MEIQIWFEKLSQRIEALPTEILKPMPELPKSEEQPTSFGYIGFLWLWRGRWVDVGLWATPSKSFSDWPVVVIQTGQASTLATNANTALPKFLMQFALVNLVTDAQELAAQWDKVANSASELHQLLGGKPETLAAVVATFSDPKKRMLFRRTDEDALQFELAQSSLSREIDRSAEFGNFSNLVDDLILKKTSDIPVESLGVWERQATCFKLGYSPITQTSFNDPVSLSRMLSFDAGLDTGVPMFGTWSNIGAGASDANLVRAADMVKEAATEIEKIELTLSEAVADGGFNYDGAAHAEVVPLLDEAGEPQRAWGVLNSAAWWMARSRGEVPQAIYDGARLLCDRHGWDDIRWVLDHNASNRK